jgi:hypothetical protein
MGLLYGRTGHLTAKHGGFRPGQMAAWLWTISQAWDLTEYARQRYNEYTNNEKAWAKDIEESGKSPAEIIEAWGGTGHGRYCHLGTLYYISLHLMFLHTKYNKRRLNDRLVRGQAGPPAAR